MFGYKIVPEHELQILKSDLELAKSELEKCEADRDIYYRRYRRRLEEVAELHDLAMVLLEENHKIKQQFSDYITAEILMR